MSKKPGYISEYTECRNCQHRWVAVYPIGAVYLECPKCHKYTVPKEVKK